MKPRKVKKTLGTHEIADICQVTPPTVIRWMEDGKLVFFTTGGGHRRVLDNDLVVFMRLHNMTVPAELAAQVKLRVLIVDDEEVARKVISRVVRGAYPGAEIEEAVDGFEAGAKIHSFLPTLITLDLQLPMLDGFKVCAMIRGNALFRNTRILAVTGSNTEEAREAILKAGADDFLGKPFSVDELELRIGKLLSA